MIHTKLYPLYDKTSFISRIKILTKPNSQIILFDI